MSVDEADIPEETLIYYSKWTLLYIIFGMLLIGVGTFLFKGIIKSPVTSSLMILFFYLFGFYNIVDGYKLFKNRQPQIIINNKGIQTSKSKFYPWTVIERILVTTIIPGSKQLSCLWFMHTKGIEIFELNSFDISKFELQRLLIIYRRRAYFEQTKSTKEKK